MELRRRSASRMAGGPTKALMDIVASLNSYITSMQTTEAGIPRCKLTEAARTGEFARVDRSLHALPDVWGDPLFIVQHRFSLGVFLDDTALFLHGMTDRAPFAPTMTFPRETMINA